MLEAETLPPPAMAIDEGHANYNPRWQQIGPRIDVLLDGKPVTHVLAYDCEAGIIERYVTDESGVPVIDRENECFRTESLSGRVEVRWREGDR